MSRRSAPLLHSAPCFRKRSRRSESKLVKSFGCKDAVTNLKALSKSILEDSGQGHQLHFWPSQIPPHPPYPLANSLLFRRFPAFFRAGVAHVSLPTRGQPQEPLKKAKARSCATFTVTVRSSRTGRLLPARTTTAPKGALKRAPAAVDRRKLSRHAYAAGACSKCAARS